MFQCDGVDPVSMRCECCPRHLPRSEVQSKEHGALALLQGIIEVFDPSYGAFRLEFFLAHGRESQEIDDGPGEVFEYRIGGSVSFSQDFEILFHVPPYASFEDVEEKSDEGRRAQSGNLGDKTDKESAYPI